MVSKTLVGRAALFADIKAGSPTSDLAYVVLYLQEDDGTEVPWDFIACKTNFDLAYEICSALREGFDYDVYLADEYDRESLYESITGKVWGSDDEVSTRVQEEEETLEESGTL